MRKQFLGILFLATALVKADPLAGTPSPAVVYFQSGATTTFVTPTFTPLGAGLLNFSASAAVSGVAFTVSGTYNPDPWMDWTLEMFSTNTGSLTAVSAGISFGSHGGPFDTLTSSMSGTLQDVAGDGGGALNVIHYPTLGLLSQLPLGLGSSCSILGTYPANTVHSCGTYGPVTGTVAAGVDPALGFVFSSSIIAGDHITYSGRISLTDSTQVTATPEPATTGLVLIAGCGLVIWRQRKKQAA